MSKYPKLIHDFSEIHEDAISKLNFDQPSADYDTISSLREWLYGLEDGKSLYVRGRDARKPSPEDMERFINENESGSLFLGFTEWTYGIAIKFQRSLFLLWNDKVESYAIGSLNYIDLLHFVYEDKEDTVKVNEPSKSTRTIVLCHGFSPDLGPNYLLMALLDQWFQSFGWRVVIPDFRPSYNYGASRGRSERVRIVLEELIALLGESDQRPSEVILIGHSQGGAAVSQTAFSSKVVKSANVRGFVMIGSESPIERIPPAIPGLEVEESTSNTITICTEKPSNFDDNSILLIHSDCDRVISHLQIRQLGELWGVPTRILQTKSTADDPIHSNWADDVQHDFIALELLPPLFTSLKDYLMQF